MQQDKQLENTIRVHEPKLRRFLYGIGAQDHEVDDVLSYVWELLWKRNLNMSAWVYGVAKYRLYKVWKKKHRERELIENYAKELDNETKMGYTNSCDDSHVWLTMHNG